MNAKEILATLKKLGKPQTAAIYKRHGSGDNVFGVLTSAQHGRLTEVKNLQSQIDDWDHRLSAYRAMPSGKPRGVAGG